MMPNDDDRPLVENSADAQQIKKARKRERQTKQQDLADWKNVLATPSGVRVIEGMLAFCHVWGFTENATPTEELQFKEGQRKVGGRILLRVLEARPDLISIMKDI